MEPTPLSLELVPLDQPPAAPAAQAAQIPIEIVPVGAPKAANLAAAPTTDRFLREATQQYAEGHIDQPLWERAFAQTNGDTDAATAIYLRARATSLRLLDRDRRIERRAQATRATPEPPADPSTAERNTVPVDEPPDRRRVWAKYRKAIMVAGVLVPLTIGGWLMSADRNAGAANDGVDKQTTSVGVPPATRTGAVAPEANTNVTTGLGPQPGSTLEFMRKVQELRDAGNWNVLVLYAVEWTRKEPANPAAWNQLRAAYVNMRQYDDALDAAGKAVQLAPDDPGMWRGLGEVNVKLDDPSAALRAYEEATAKDGQDVDSLRQIAILNARLGRVPEAKLALDRALGISPQDATALCLRSSVAQLPGSPKDAQAAARQVRAIDIKCPG